MIKALNRVATGGASAMRADLTYESPIFGVLNVGRLVVERVAVDEDQGDVGREEGEEDVVGGGRLSLGRNRTVETV